MRTSDGLLWVWKATRTFRKVGIAINLASITGPPLVLRTIRSMMMEVAPPLWTRQ